MFKRLFLDTSFIAALADKNDQHRGRAEEILPELKDAQELVVTEAVLVEVGNFLRRFHRLEAGALIRRYYDLDSATVVEVTTELLMQGVDRYEGRPDKDWSLTDCISFVVMERKGLKGAVTADHHFEQAGFRALLRE